VTAAVFMDRDGVINKGVMDEERGQYESPYHAADVELEDRAAEGLRLLRGLGWPLIVVSNQPAAAKGIVTLAELWEVHDRVVELLAEEGVALDDWRYCFHHPQGKVPQLSGPCPCRKPLPGMLRAAASKHDIDLEGSWTIGDTDTDVGAGRAAGARTVLVENPRSAHKRGGAAGEDFRAADLAAAASVVVGRAGGRSECRLSQPQADKFDTRRD
jgi:D-glycero-D-manno-heptose 1,7-bisphosphate phosphatase